MMKIGFIGNGWRTRGYLRIVRQVPERFEVSGILFRDPEKAAAFEKEFPGKTYTDIDRFLQADHDMVFLLLLGFVPSYYMAMLIFTWGEIFSVLSEGPYVSTRVPASHRGRINGLMAVVYTGITGCIDLSVGHLYDRAGSTWTWVLILAITVASAAATVILKSLDRKAYPKLYLDSPENGSDTD